MAKQYDLKDLGEVYGNLGKETAVLAEDTQSLTVGDAKAGIGSADILPGGPTKEAGFEEPTVDVTKCGDKNPYNVKAYSYGADNDPGVGAEEPAPTGEDALHGEEDEEGKKPDEDGDGVGMGWFPGYAVDVETGQRLNVFFSENSTYGGNEAIDTMFSTGTGVGRDMMFNPTSDDIIPYPGDDGFAVANAHERRFDLPQVKMEALG